VFATVSGEDGDPPHRASLAKLQRDHLQPFEFQRVECRDAEFVFRKLQPPFFEAPGKVFGLELLDTFYECHCLVLVLWYEDNVGSATRIKALQPLFFSKILSRVGTKTVVMWWSLKQSTVASLKS
jgi:hypothetical protein